MTTEAQPTPESKSPKPNLSIKTFGIGGAGIKVIEQLIPDRLSGMSFVALDTDPMSISGSSAGEKTHLETKMLRGLGTGGDPERGAAAAEEHVPRLRALCEGTDVVFVVVGLGGGAGTGIGPVLARTAKQAGALVLGFVALPFDCEGSRRARLAMEGLAELKAAADGVVCLTNQKVFKLIDENTSVLETFKFTAGLLADATRGIWRLLAHSGLLEIHFNDVCELLRDRHLESCFAVAEAMGATRSREVVDKLLAHPMLDGGKHLNDAEAVLISLSGGPDLTMAEVNRVMEQIRDHCEHAQVIMGAAIDETLIDRMAVTLIASRKASQPVSAPARLGGPSRRLAFAIVARKRRSAAPFPFSPARAFAGA